MNLSIVGCLVLLFILNSCDKKRKPNLNFDETECYIKMLNDSYGLDSIKEIVEEDLIFEKGYLFYVDTTIDFVVVCERNKILEQHEIVLHDFPSYKNYLDISDSVISFNKVNKFRINDIFYSKEKEYWIEALDSSGFFREPRWHIVHW